jgi:hypothetical protein
MHQITYRTILRGNDLLALGDRLCPDFIALWKMEQPCRCSLEVCLVGYADLDADDDPEGAGGCVLGACLAVLGSSGAERLIDITPALPRSMVSRFEIALSGDPCILTDGLADADGTPPNTSEPIRALE